ncbi:MAG: cyanophycin synthetase, partial [Candidatus Omnitrophota bacterium]
SGRNFVSYGFSPECNVSAKDIRIQGLTSRFECWIDGKSRGEFILNVPGRHNVLNALACITLGWLFEIDWDVIRKSLKKYRGVQRRFQIKGEINDILVVDDYGHHPTEIKATLAAAQSLQRKRMIVAFQPHRYTRTKYLLDEFADSLLLPDYLIIADIYAASEAPMEGVTSQKLVEKITKRHPGEVVYLKREDILTHLKKIVRPGDLVLTLGAGDLNQIGEEFVCYLQNKSR